MRQAECVSDSIYKSRCLKRLRELGLPTEGWVCEWIEDTDEPEAVCELCGCARVRFLHHMRHPMVGHTIAVGCLCDGIMSGDELGAYEREREARNRARRRQTFIHGKWAPSWLSLIHISQLIRTALIPSPGKTFFVSDFSAIEARVIAWLAGEQWRQQVFAEGKDIYCASASQMFGVPVEKHGVNGHLRQKGKIAELALGYGGSVGALKAMGAIEMGLKEDELKPLVDAWRTANPMIVKLWWEVDRAVTRAVSDKTATETHGMPD